jgi:autotransporter-associated beta strand protein
VDVYSGTLAGLQSTMLATASASSAIFYWDTQGTTGANPYTGSMTGTWENKVWSYTSVGLAGPTNWVDGKAVCFGVHTGSGTPAYTVTMNSSHVVAGFFDGGLSPKACDVTITGSGIINLASGPQALDSNNGSDGSSAYLRINCVIAGNGQLYPEGNGQSFLNATNTFTGGTTLGYPGVPFSGTVNFNNGSAFGTGPIALTNTGTGGALVLEGTSAVTVTNPVSVGSATTNNIVGNAAGLTFSGNWTMGANLLTLGTGATAGNQTIISGVLSGTAGLTTYNSGTLVLSGVNTYSGTTAINSPAVLTIGGTGKLGNGSYAGSIVNNGTFNYNSTASQTLSGVISGSGPLRLNNAGLLALTGVNTYSGGTTVSSGATLGIAADSALGASTAGLTLNGGCLKNNNSAPTVTSSRTITLGASGGYLDAGWAPSDPLTINAKLTGSGQLLINQDGSPVVLANTANNYTGNTIIGVNGPGYYALGTAAWLKLGASNVLPNGAGYGDVCISNAWNGRLDLAGFSDTINGLWGDGLITNTAASASSLTVGANNVSSTFAGTIKTTTGTIALTKTGTGALTLSGAGSTYTGGTTVSVGTLSAQAAGALGTGNATVANGAVLQLADPSALGSGATLTLSASPSAGAVALSFIGTQTNNALYFGTTQKAAGTWAASGATHNNAAFTGSGVLYVTTGPASSTVLSLTSGSNPSTYGNALTFTATVTGNSPGGTVQLQVDGLAVGSPVTLVGGSAPLVTSTLTVSGSPHQITAAYSGDDNNNPSSPASALSQMVTPATLTVTGIGANNKTYDGNTNATLNTAGAALVGKIGADNVTLNTAGATGAFADANVGTGKTVTISGLSLTGGDAGNYSLTAPTASANITGASTTTLLTSSANPSGPGTNVTFTVTLSAVPPTIGTPTGDVVFLANNVPFSTNTLVSGSIGASTTSLPLGTNTVSAQYAAQGNYLGSTGIVQQVVQSAVVPGPTNIVASFVNNGDGTFTLNFIGTPQAQYCVVAYSDLAVPMSSWVPLAGSTNTVTNTSGLWSFTVTNTTAQQFYRSAVVAPTP